MVKTLVNLVTLISFMSISKATQILNKSKLILVVGVLFGAVLAMLGTFFMDMQYKTNASFIVIQEQRFSDSFTQAKSAEYLGGILSRIVETDSFRKIVLTDNPRLASLLPTDEIELRKEWRNTIDARAAEDSGIVTLSVYHEDARASNLILTAIGDTLTANTGKYLGETAQVNLSKIDGPITSEFPVRPNIGLNALAGAIIGGLVFASVILLRASSKRVKRERDKKLLEVIKMARNTKDSDKLGDLVKKTRSITALF